MDTIEEYYIPVNCPMVSDAYLFHSDFPDMIRIHDRCCVFKPLLLEQK